ncbi:MAG TPA: hypothetical protein VFL15_08570 [Gammaproteobacteria bacterium]|nr:hypothetical protein [Gammaproteobacteria bacterium]
MAVSKNGLAGILLGFLLALPGHAADLQGRLVLTGPDGVADTRDITDAVVFFKPDASAHGPLPHDTATMLMQHKTFLPHVLAVTIGSTVRFPNDDPILHNAFSTSPGDQFDLGLYRNGASKTVTFERGGLVRVFCNVHHQMFAYILVLDTPYIGHVQSGGQFDLHGLPSGPGELVIWHPRTSVWRQHLDSLAAAPSVVNLHVIRTGVPAHFNKYGKPYKKDADSGY